MLDLPITYRGAVYPSECDHVGHMNVAYYVAKFDGGTWNFFALLGLMPSYFRRQGRGMAAVQQNVTYKRELLPGDIVEIKSRLLEVIVRPVTAIFRDASHVVLASGAGLLLSSGYVLDRWVFPSAVYIPPVRGVLLWGGVAVGLIMWVLVQAVIWPALAVILDPAAPATARDVARLHMRTAARVNLMLAAPVTLVMVAAGHLY